MNSGTVLLARFLYFEGNCVVIDHGQGLLTLYFHLSEFKVKEGDAVKRGQEIGLSGGTGRATGPHLHVAVRWQGTYLDPARLMQIAVAVDCVGNACWVRSARAAKVVTRPVDTTRAPPKLPSAQRLHSALFQSQDSESAGAGNSDARPEFAAAST